MQKGSNNRNKQRIRVARFQEKMANQRKDLVVSLKDLGRKLASEKENINEYTDYSFMKFLALGKTDGLSCQSFNSCS